MIMPQAQQIGIGFPVFSCFWSKTVHVHKFVQKM